MDLKNYAKKEKIKYFMVTYTDLFGVQRAKLVPAAAISDMQKDGAGFAGFASWLDMTPAYPDMLAVPDPQSCLLYTSPSPRDYAAARMPSTA